MSDTGIGDLVDRMTRTRDGNQSLIDALVAQNVALDAAITVLNGDAPPAAPTPAELPVKKALPAAKVADKRTVTKHDYPKIAPPTAATNRYPPPIVHDFCTEATYVQHRRAGIEPCAGCLLAHAHAQADRREFYGRPSRAKGCVTA